MREWSGSACVCQSVISIGATFLSVDGIAFSGRVNRVNFITLLSRNMFDENLLLVLELHCRRLEKDHSSVRRYFILAEICKWHMVISNSRRFCYNPIKLEPVYKCNLINHQRHDEDMFTNDCKTIISKSRSPAQNSPHPASSTSSRPPNPPYSDTPCCPTNSETRPPDT